MVVETDLADGPGCRRCGNNSTDERCRLRFALGELPRLMWVDAYAEPDTRPEPAQLDGTLRFGVVLRGEDAQRVFKPRRPRPLDDCLAIGIKCRIGQMAM